MSHASVAAAIALSLGVASAQSPFLCARVDAPGVIRAEGLTELLPDIVVDCTGGTAGYNSIYTVLLTIEGAWAMRPPFTPPPANGPSGPSTAAWNEALLLIGDPSPAAQVACLPAPDFDSCAPHTGANVFPARRLDDRLIGFTEIPLTAPGNGAVQRYRITNLRVNAPASFLFASSATTGLLARNEITTSLQMFDYLGNLVQVGARESVSATTKSAYSLQLLDSTGNAVSDSTPALVASPSVVPLNTPVNEVSFLAAFQEGFESAFRRRNVATTALSPSSVQSQNIPGLAFYTETGFFNTALPLTTPLILAGSADSGTRLRLSFENIPKNILVWVTIRDTDTWTTPYDADNPKALLTYSNPNGDGAFSPVSPYIPGWAQLYNDNGTSEAVWEVVTTDPAAIEKIAFRVALTSQGTAGTGAATLRGSIAPFVELAVGETTVADTLSVVPHFQALAVDQAAFTLTDSLKTSPATFTSAASFSTKAIAPDSFASAFGTDLASDTIVAPYPWPMTLGGKQVEVIDATGVSRLGKLLFVSAEQVNFLVPAGTPPGVVLINLVQDGITTATGFSNVQTVAPGLFSADGSGRGAAAGGALRVMSGGANLVQLLAEFDSAAGIWKTVPIELSADATVYVSFYGSGVRNRSSLGAVTATVGGVPVPVRYAGPQSEYDGLDQINIGPLPDSLRGRGEVDVVISADGIEANRVRIAVQ